MPFNGPLQYPQINGVRYEWTSITFAANGQPIVGIQELNYDHELKPGEVYGTLAQKIGATRGQYKATASFTILELEYQALITALCALNGTPGSGYLEVRFDIQVQKQDGVGSYQGPLITDLLRGCKLVKPSAAYKKGPDELVRKCDLDLFYIVENGQLPIGVSPFPKMIPG
jgi:hypothetical protein